MADDLDVEALLEAPFRKDGDEAPEPHSDSKSPSYRTEERRKKHKKRRSHHSPSRSRSRSRSRSPRRRRRSRSRERHRRSGSREHRRSRKERRRSRSRERYRSRSPPYVHRRNSPPFRFQRKNSPPYQRPNYGRKTGHVPATDMSFANSGRKGPPSPDPEPPSEDRDRRTVMCMQLSARVGPKELEEFFQKVGQVKEVKMIADKNSRRSKGIAYVEFHDEKSVLPAMGIGGQKLFGVPIIVQPTMAEKNRLAAQAQNLKKAEGPRKLYVGSLHYNMSENMLKPIFEAFGHVDKVSIQRDEAGVSKGYGFVEFRDSDAAERAMSNLNGFELAGRPMKVNHVTERDTSAMEHLDGEDRDGGVGMTPQSRAALMARLAEGHNTGLTVPQLPQVSVPNIPAISTCIMLSNMFDPTSENEPGWDKDIHDDVLEECMHHGPVMHIYVDPFSQGNVYVKCLTPQVAAAVFNNMNGRFFAGKKIVAQFIAETTYNIKFPAALAAVVPLKPSS